ncbi:unnamed protein product [Prorocentrum cordatum]|uniref:RanBP2-type domain-containing protein n=1 Tax=Prorocentrum cordatum TaxID=2364126 RepID=A0ABN9URN9_9DINO|nr:unnamed protein product [Polarella glacialis]
MQQLVVHIGACFLSEQLGFQLGKFCKGLHAAFPTVRIVVCADGRIWCPWPRGEAHQPSVLMERARNRKTIEDAKKEKDEKKQFENYLQQELEQLASWKELQTKIEEMDIRNLSGISMEAEDPLATPAPLKVHQQSADCGEKNCEEGKYHKTGPKRKYSKEETLDEVDGRNMTEVDKPKKRTPWVPSPQFRYNTKHYVKIWRCKCAAANFGFRKECYWCGMTPPPETVALQRKQLEEMVSCPWDSEDYPTDMKDMVATGDGTMVSDIVSDTAVSGDIEVYHIGEAVRTDIDKVGHFSSESQSASLMSLAPPMSQQQFEKMASNIIALVDTDSSEAMRQMKALAAMCDSPLAESLGT